MARVVYVTREVGSVVGGIGARVLSQALTLADEHEVTVVTSSLCANEVEGCRQLDPRVRWLVVDEPVDDRRDGYFSLLHHFSARVFDALCDMFEREGPADYVEFTDYLGIAMVTVQARVTRDPRLAATRVGVRLCMTSEMFHVIDGDLSSDAEITTTYDMERYSLRFADVVTHAPHGDIYESYQRFYGADALAPPELVEHVTRFAERHTPLPSAANEPLKLLYLGRMHRQKGVHNLVEALAGSELENWTLTLVGGDTNTNTLRTSMRTGLEQASAIDPRIEFRDRVPHEQIADLITEHDAVIIPSLWECHPNVGVEALANNRPLLATPVGGNISLAREGESGMLATGTDARALADLVARALASREQLIGMADEGLPLARFRVVSDRKTFRAAVDRLVAERHEVAAPPTEQVSAVVPYYRLAQHVGQTIDSLLEQDFALREIVVVNDGSFEPADAVLEEIAELPGVRVLTTMQSGPSAARAFGMSQTDGEFVLFIDADDWVEPQFVSRAAATLSERTQAGFVSAWQRYVSEDGSPMTHPDGYHPFGSFCDTRAPGVSVFGGSTMLVRRAVVDPDSDWNAMSVGTEDTEFHLRLKARGLGGHIVPQYLANYRVRDDSGTRTVNWPNREMIERELRSGMRSLTMQWTAEPARETTSDAASRLAQENDRLAAALDAAAAAGGELSEPPALSERRRLADELTMTFAENERLIADIAREVDDLTREYNGLASRIAGTDAVIAEHTETLRKIHESRAWRALAPLRGAKQLLRR